jgi:hypothetical protein
MKRLLTLLLSAGSLVSANAQEGIWLNYPTAVNEYIGSEDYAIWAATLFHNDNINLVDDPSDPFPAQTQHVASIINPTDEIFGVFNPGETLVLNAVSLPYLYERSTSSIIEDTLEISIIGHSEDISSFEGVNNSEFQTILYDQANNRISPSNVIYSYKLPLTTAHETGDDLESIEVDIPSIVVNPNERIGVSFTFRPGYSHSINDYIGDKNQFSVIFNEQWGEETTPDISMYNLNNSYLITPSIFNDENEFGWNGTMIPTGAYTEPGNAYEDLYVDFLFEADNGLSVVDLEITQPDCVNPNGSFTYNVTGGNGPYTVSNVSNYQPNEVPPGTHLFTFTDSNGLSISQTIEIIEVEQFDASIQFNNVVLTASEGASYEWYLNDVLIFGAEGQEYTPTENGTYKVIITNDDDCDATASLVISNLGISEDQLAQLNIYPNPVQDQLTIELPADMLDQTHIVISNVQGKIVNSFTARETSQRVDMSNFPAGNYMITYQYKGETINKKFVLK